MTDDIDHEYTDSIVCPHCGHAHDNDLPDPRQVSNPYRCYGCGRKFVVRVHCDIRYSTWEEGAMTTPDQPASLWRVDATEEGGYHGRSHFDDRGEADAFIREMANEYGTIHHVTEYRRMGECGYEENDLMTARMKCGRHLGDVDYQFCPYCGNRIKGG